MSKEIINYNNVSNPASLEKILNKFYTELAEVRTLTNELKTDLTAHTHTYGTLSGTVSGSVATINAGATGAGNAISSSSVTEYIVGGK